MISGVNVIHIFSKDQCDYYIHSKISCVPKEMDENEGSVIHCSFLQPKMTMI